VIAGQRLDVLLHAAVDNDHHKAGVPTVAGTDNSGIEIVRELEIYVQAGFSPAEALSAATIVSTRVVGQDAKTGSIKVGNAADVALIEGDPSAHRRSGSRDSLCSTANCSTLTHCGLRQGFRGQPRSRFFGYKRVKRRCWGASFGLQQRPPVFWGRHSAGKISGLRDTSKSTALRRRLRVGRKVQNSDIARLDCKMFSISRLSASYIGV
jgi:hypothetical protein